MSTKHCPLTHRGRVSGLPVRPAQAGRGPLPQVGARACHHQFSVTVGTGCRREICPRVPGSSPSSSTASPNGHLDPALKRQVGIWYELPAAPHSVCREPTGPGTPALRHDQPGRRLLRWGVRRALRPRHLLEQGRGRRRHQRRGPPDLRQDPRGGLLHPGHDQRGHRHGRSATEGHPHQERNSPKLAPRWVFGIQPCSDAIGHRGVAQWRGACLGSRRSPVRVRPPRPSPRPQSRSPAKKHRGPPDSRTGRWGRPGASWGIRQPLPGTSGAPPERFHSPPARHPVPAGAGGALGADEGRVVATGANRQGSPRAPWGGWRRWAGWRRSPRAKGSMPTMASMICTWMRLATRGAPPWCGDTPSRVPRP